MNLDFGLDRATFRADYFERKPVLMRQAFQPRAELWSVLDDALGVVDPSADYIKLMHGGRIDQATFVEDYVDIGVRRRRLRKDVLYERLAAGATLVVNRMDICSPAVADMCMQVARFVGTQASANGYASFGSQPATKVHWDTHDVFVIQLAGRKRWRVFEPTVPLPVSNQISTERHDDLPAEPWLDDVVEAGDLLYVPRGWWHRVTPLEDTETFHLAVGVHAPLVLDYLIWACANKLPAHLAMRHGLVGRESEPSLVSDALETVSAVLSDPATLLEFEQRSKARERVVSTFAVSKLFGAAAEGIDGRDLLHLNSRYEQGQRNLVINGQIRRLKLEELEVIDIVVRHPKRSIGDLTDEISTALPKFASIVKNLVAADILGIRPIYAVPVPSAGSSVKSPQ